MAVTAEPAVRVHSPPLRLTHFQIFRISALWLGLQFFWTTQQLIVMPHYVVHFVGEDHKGFYLGLLKSTGAVMSLLVQLTLGYLSDHTYSRLGRRRPWIINGLLWGLPSIALFMFAPSYWWLVFAYMCIELTMNTASVAFQALLPDLVPEAQHHDAGAQMSLNHLAGNLISLIFFAGVALVFGSQTVHVFGDDKPTGYIYLLLPAYVVLLAIAGGLVTFGINEEGWMRHAREALIGKVRELRLLPGAVIRYVDEGRGLLGTIISHYRDALKLCTPNLLWLSVSRFAIHFGYYTFLHFSFFFAKSNLRGEEWLVSLGIAPEKAPGMVEGDAMVAPLLASFIIGGVVGSMLGPRLARSIGRKAVIASGVVWSGALFLPLIFTTNPWVAAGLGIALGIGWGAFLAIDWSFACSLMPKTVTGTFMGLWDITTLLPQILAPIIAGPIFDAIFAAHKAALGIRGANAVACQWVLCLVVVYFAAGLFLLRPLREERRVA